MDSLYHFIFALVGGYVLVKGLGVRYNFLILTALAFFSILIDIDHLLGFHFFHNVFVLTPFVLLFFIALFMKLKRVQLYSLILVVILYGHLLADMTYGMGIPLFYPLDSSMKKVPYPAMKKNFVSPFGMTLLLYFGAIALLVLIYRIVKTVKCRRCSG